MTVMGRYFGRRHPCRRCDRNPCSGAHFNIHCWVNITRPGHGEAKFSSLASFDPETSCAASPPLLSRTPLRRVRARAGRQRSRYRLRASRDAAEPIRLRRYFRACFRPRSGANARTIRRRLHRSAADRRRRPPPQTAAANASEPASDAEAEPEPQFQRQEVDYTGPEAPGTIVVDTPDKFLFLVEPNGKALRYGIGVGRPGFDMVGRQADQPQGRMAGLDAACADGVAPSRPASPYGRRALTTRSAQGRSISAPRSTAFTAPTSLRRSATTSRQAASG